MTLHTCLITGGNAGIGKAAATQLAAQGAEVIIATRSEERGEAAVAEIRAQSSSDAVSLVVMDLSSRQSILDGCQAFREGGHGRLDALVHNAADFDISRKEPVYSADGIETVWATNHVGPVLLTQQLAGELSRSEQGRVITVSSQGLILHPFLQVDLEDPEFRRGGFRVDKAYYQAKLAQVMFTYWLAEQFRGTPMTANCIRVTNVKIDVARYPDLSDFQKRLYSIKSRFSISPAQMAEVYAWLSLAPEVAHISGGYFDEKRKQVNAGRYASDADNIRRVMELTARYVPGLQAGIGPTGQQ
ncbi:MAG TPA: SDR family NAD(P)-dependent oxidoreductase [Coriobacteriia bacterium]|nr:SDR family NAD(P)-dependent oxidoreductase [Coriobacteriia bacterium]